MIFPVVPPVVTAAATTSARAFPTRSPAAIDAPPLVSEPNALNERKAPPRGPNTLMRALPSATARISALPSPLTSPAATRTPTSLLSANGGKPDIISPLEASTTFTRVQHPASRPSTTSARPSPFVSPVATNAPADQAASLNGRSEPFRAKVRPLNTRSSVNADFPSAVTISLRPSPSTSPTATRTPFWYVGYGENPSGNSPHGANVFAWLPNRSHPRTSGQPASCPVMIAGGTATAGARPARKGAAA